MHTRASNPYLPLNCMPVNITIHTGAIYPRGDRCEGKTTGPQCNSLMQLNRKGTKREEAAVEGQGLENERWGLVRRREKKKKRASVDGKNENRNLDLPMSNLCVLFL